VQGGWQRDLQPVSRDKVKALQESLNDRGFAAGAADGQLGPATRQALRAWQRSQSLPADGYPTLEMLAKLQAP
jgi:membrane-bound lytic murein transglycosylase B